DGRAAPASLDAYVGVTAAIRAAGMQAGIEPAGHSMEPATAPEAARLELQPGSDVLVVERVRTADGKPVVLSRDLLPRRLIAKQPGLADEMLNRSISEVLEGGPGVMINYGVASCRRVRGDWTRPARRVVEALADTATRTSEAVAGGANVIMMSKGMIRVAEPAFAPTTSLALLLSASANPEQGEPEVVQIAEVEEAARLGADAVVL